MGRLGVDIYCSSHSHCELTLLHKEERRFQLLSKFPYGASPGGSL